MLTETTTGHKKQAKKYSYENCLSNSVKVQWNLDEVLDGVALDFSKNFLPGPLARTDDIACLSDDEKRKLNQIRGYTYVHLFRFIEEFIIAQTLEQAREFRFGDEVALRSLLRLAEEEVKHQALFKRYEDLFTANFGSECDVVEGAEQVAESVLQNSQLCVLTLIAMVEWAALLHYMEHFRDDKQRLDPAFFELLRIHWVEESQHAKLDNLEAERIASQVTPEQREAAIDELLGVIGGFDELLQNQAAMDLVSLERAVGRTFTEQEKAEIAAVQEKSYRYTFLVSPMEGQQFQELLGQITTDGLRKIQDKAKELMA